MRQTIRKIFIFMYLIPALSLLSCKTTASHVALAGAQPTAASGRNQFGFALTLEYLIPGGYLGGGSGVLLEGGIILTNAHVIEDMAERTSPLRIRSGNQMILVEGQVSGLKLVKNEHYEDDKTDATDFRYDLGFVKIEGGEAIFANAGIVPAVIANQGINTGDEITYVGSGFDEKGRVGQRRYATTRVDMLVGDAQLIVSSLPHVVLADGRRSRCLESLCRWVGSTQSENEIHVRGGDSGGAVLNAEGKLVGLMAMSNDNGFNGSVNLLSANTHAWLVQQAKVYGFSVPPSRGYDQEQRALPAPDPAPALKQQLPRSERAISDDVSGRVVYSVVSYDPVPRGAAPMAGAEYKRIQDLYAPAAADSSDTSSDFGSDAEERDTATSDRKERAKTGSR